MIRYDKNKTQHQILRSKQKFKTKQKTKNEKTKQR